MLNHATTRNPKLFGLSYYNLRRVQCRISHQKQQKDYLSKVIELTEADIKLTFFNTNEPMTLIKNIKLKCFSFI